MMKCVRILCAAALLCLGFAHKPPMPDWQPAQAAELSQYTFPDGSPHVLCLPGDANHGEHDGPDFGSGCEACRLIASLLPPAPQDTTGWLIRLPADRFVPLRAEALRRPFLLPNAAPRGPPSGPAVRTAAVSTAAVLARAG